eukprot:scaffold1867_cov247-Pinguiococcus_pyrenoidosus.AAC.27
MKTNCNSPTFVVFQRVKGIREGRPDFGDPGEVPRLKHEIPNLVLVVDATKVDAGHAPAALPTVLEGRVEPERAQARRAIRQWR